MLTADGLTEEALTEMLSAAALANADTRNGRPSNTVPVDFQTPEMRAVFAVREANMVWLTRHASALGALLAEYATVVR